MFCTSSCCTPGFMAPGLFTKRPAAVGAAKLFCMKVGALSKGRCIFTLFTNKTPSRFSTTGVSTSSTSSSTKPLSLASWPVHQLVASIQPVTSSLSRPVFFAYRLMMFSLMVSSAFKYCCMVVAS